MRFKRSPLACAIQKITAAIASTPSGPAKRRATFTDPEGDYLFDDITPGEWGLSAELSYFEPTTRLTHGTLFHPENNPFKVFTTVEEAQVVASEIELVRLPLVEPGEWEQGHAEGLDEDLPWSLEEPDREGSTPDDRGEVGE